MEAAWELLQHFTRAQAAGTAQPLLATPAKRAALREALLVRPPAAAEACVLQRPAAGGRPGSGTVVCRSRAVCSRSTLHCAVPGALRVLKRHPKRLASYTVILAGQSCDARLSDVRRY